MRFAQATAIAEKAAGLRAGRQPSRDVPVCDPRAIGDRNFSSQAAMPSQEFVTLPDTPKP
jgi:hypothetical protein